MVQLLQKLSIRATNGPDKLLKVVKGPVTKYFPPGERGGGRGAVGEEGGVTGQRPSPQASACVSMQGLGSCSPMACWLDPVECSLAGRPRPCCQLWHQLLCFFVKLTRRHARLLPRHVCPAPPFPGACSPLQVPSAPPSWLQPGSFSLTSPHTSTPADAQRIGFSHSAKTLVSMHEWVQRPELGERPLVFVVGAFAHGKIDDSYVDEYISISQVRVAADVSWTLLPPLLRAPARGSSSVHDTSAAVAVSRRCGACRAGPLAWRQVACSPAMRPAVRACPTELAMLGCAGVNAWPDRSLPARSGEACVRCRLGACLWGSHSHLQGPAQRFARGCDKGTTILVAGPHWPHCRPGSSVLQFPLSAAYALCRITTALEQKYGIV